MVNKWTVWWVNIEMSGRLGEKIDAWELEPVITCLINGRMRGRKAEEMARTEAWRSETPIGSTWFHGNT